MATRKLTGGVREDEICRILNLKKNLDYSDILVKYAGKYMKMGWDLVAVNFKGEEALDLDFQEPQAVWSERLTGWGLEGPGQFGGAHRRGFPPHGPGGASGGEPGALQPAGRLVFGLCGRSRGGPGAAL